MNSKYANIIQESIAPNTRIAYARAWERFTEFCQERDYDPLPADPEHVVDFLVEQATQPTRRGQPLAMGTVVLLRSAINQKHRSRGLASPTTDAEVVEVMRGLTRIRGAAVRRVEALREYHIEDMLGCCGERLIGLRDAALLALGFAAALRRSEICALQVRDCELEPDGSRMILTIRRSKTDQQGLGQRIAIPEGKRIQPIMRLRRWLLASGITDGFVFQSMNRSGGIKGRPLHNSDIPRLIKAYAARIGLQPKNFSGHSLRAGFVTSAAAHHARLDKIMEVTRHRNPATVLQYIRDANVFADHAGEKFL